MRFRVCVCVRVCVYVLVFVTGFLETGDILVKVTSPSAVYGVDKIFHTSFHTGMVTDILALTKSELDDAAKVRTPQIFHFFFPCES